MALSKEYEYKVEVLPNRVLQVRKSCIIVEDGVDIATSYERHVVNPGEDYSGDVEVVRLIAAALHTPAAIAAYQSSLPQGVVEDSYGS